MIGSGMAADKLIVGVRPVGRRTELLQKRSNELDCRSANVVHRPGKIALSHHHDVPIAELHAVDAHMPCLGIVIHHIDIIDRPGQAGAYPAGVVPLVAQIGERQCSQRNMTCDVPFPFVISTSLAP